MTFNFNKTIGCKYYKLVSTRNKTIKGLCNILPLQRLLLLRLISLIILSKTTPKTDFNRIDLTATKKRPSVCLSDSGAGNHRRTKTTPRLTQGAAVAAELHIYPLRPLNSTLPPGPSRHSVATKPFLLSLCVFASLGTGQLGDA